jgi:uncharacterized membrane protein YhaH (DUF805 family)
METQAEWYFVDGNGQQTGPVPISSLKEHVASGLVTGNTMIWTEGMAEWLPASSVEGMIQAPVTQTYQSPNIQKAQSPQTQINPYSTPQADLGMSVATAENTSLRAKLFSFEGRIPRRAYWGYSFLIVGIFYAIVLGLIFTLGEKSKITMVVMMVLYVPLIWASIAIQAKRWHDRDKSGWWYFIAFIPFIGGIWAFIECGCLRGTFGLNTYGDDPT